MAKKKKKRNITQDSDSSDDPKLINSGPPLTFDGKGCTHVTKAVNIKAARNILKKSVVVTACQQQECKEEDDKKESRANGTTENDHIANGFHSDTEQHLDIWMCLQCSFLGCGRNSKSQHALKHYNTPRSEPHAIVVNTYTWMIWCYGCDDEIRMETSKKLTECVEFIKKHVMKSNGVHPPAANITNTSNHSEDEAVNREIENPHAEHNGSMKKCSEVVNGVASVPSANESRPKVKGLQNLGNTCFLNSICQSICQTHYLEMLICESSRKDRQFSLAGTSNGDESAHICEASSDSEDDCTEQISLPEVRLPIVDGPGPLSQAMSSMLKDMRTSKINTLSPSTLLSQIVKKAPQFKGYRQQDAHEALRYIMDGMRAEELKRVQCAILKHFQLHRNTQPGKVEVTTRKKLKVYGKQVQTFIDAQFGGLLQSTVQCQSCGYVSQVHESFLDLSLPLSEMKARRSGFSLHENLPANVEVIDMNKRASTGPHRAMDEICHKPSKHAEKKRKRDNKKRAKSTRLSKEKDESIKDDDNVSDMESLAIGDADVEDNNDVDIANTSMTSGEQNGITPSKKKNRRSNSDDEQEMCNDLRRLSFSNLPDSNNNQCNDSKAAEARRAVTQKQKQQQLVDSMKALAPRTNADSSATQCKFSVESCLTQFTALELLTGGNKYGCIQCTRSQKADKTDTKKVYVNASKQYLIYNPPVCLTLHFKRFQQSITGLKKINHHVSFSTVLDIGPFCSSSSRCLVKKDQSQVLYSLYAVVEHHGMLSNGHYVAYVKARQESTSMQYFLTKKLLSMQHCMVDAPYSECIKRQRQHTVEPSAKIDEKGGNWYHVSDSHVKSVPLSQVLNSQAYILFYERVY